LKPGVLAKQADGAVVVRMGRVYAARDCCKLTRTQRRTDFLPLTVDYQENMPLPDGFPGGFFKREARPSDYEILISRLIDRALRPTFPEDYHAEIQVLVTLISWDKKCGARFSCRSRSIGRYNYFRYSVQRTYF
jgi:polyribonucleotide nucleotidyltransferase